MTDERTHEFEALESLAQHRPDDATASRALERARAALRERATSHTLFSRRWLMRISAAAAIVIVGLIGVFMTFGPAPHVSAADMLRNAVEGRARYDGWYAMDMWRAEGSDWRLMGTFHGLTGRRLILLNDDNGEPMFQYVDPPADVLAQYAFDTKTLHVVPLSASRVAPPLPTTDRQLIEMSDMTDRYAVERADHEGQVRIELRKRPLPTDADETQRNSYPYLPVRVTCDLDAQTKLIRQISVQQGEHDDLVPWVRYRYGVEPIPPLDDLPLPEGATIDDQRPDVVTTGMIDALDAVQRDGLGFDTAILVMRTGDRFRGTLNDGGRLTLYAERAGMWLQFMWDDGGDIAGWPEPHMDEVLAYARQHAPQRVGVYDGRTLWWHDVAGQPWQTEHGEDAIGRERYYRLAPDIWWGRSELFYNYGNSPPIVTSRRDPDRSNGVVIESTIMTHWQGTPPGEMRPGERRTMHVLEDLGPLPVIKTIERFNADGSRRELMTWEYSLGDMEMYRAPVRVPLYWTRRSEATHNPGLPQFYHLMPQPERTLDATWFTDPRQRWPSK